LTISVARPANAFFCASEIGNPVRRHRRTVFEGTEISRTARARQNAAITIMNVRAVNDGVEQQA
jgi:hypothetical protein